MMRVAAISRNTLLVALGAAAVVAAAAFYLFDKHKWAASTLASIEPRYARLLGLQSSAADLDKALTDRRAILARHAYLSTQDVAQAGSDAQQRVREIFGKAGLDVASTQVLPAKAADGFDRIPLVLRLEGDLAALQAALTVLPNQSPTLFAEGFNVQTSGIPRPDAPPRLSMQVNLFVLRMRP
jgi:general secretion pathway protein M